MSGWTRLEAFALAFVTITEGGLLVIGLLVLAFYHQ